MYGTPGISVIVCCYNSSPRLPNTLKYLAAQKVPVHIPWEIVIVDNASTDNTSIVSKEEWKKYGADSAPLQVVSESKTGLVHAREKGISISKYEYCLFCDDDNWLQEDYVKIAFEIMSADLTIGMLGGKGEEVCEISPPLWFEDMKKTYAVGKQAHQTGDITNQKGHVYGACSVLRKQALMFVRECGLHGALIGRSKEKLVSGEDTELCLQIRLLGYRIHYSEDLLFKHFISKNRLCKSYFNKMNIGMARAYVWVIGYNHICENRYNTRKTMYWLRDAVFLLHKNVLPSFLNLLKELFSKNSYQSQTVFLFYFTVFVEFIKANVTYDTFLRDIYQKIQQAR